MTELPETILQFGTGRFLRGFADRFIHQANEQGQGIGRVVVVQSTGDKAARQLNACAGRFHVVVRGLEYGQRVDRIEDVSCVSRALAARSEWRDLVELARSPHLRYVLSNTTEAGYALDPSDRPGQEPPHSFPAKLLSLLHERFRAEQPGLTIIPCELIQNQADVLKRVIVALAENWRQAPTFLEWLRTACIWLNTLVDRIIVGPPKDHPLYLHDPLLIMAEPFAFWALQEKPGAGHFIRNPAIVRASDIEPYFLRKVRILNAAHTALVTKARPRGFPIVREAMADPELSGWLERLLLDEIVPTLDGRVDDGVTFARHTLERFRNPFLEHKISDIMQNHDMKVRIRLLPTREEFVAEFGRRPPLLDEVLALNGL